jgi:tRNA/rRNA methyltransferase
VFATCAFDRSMVKPVLSAKQAAFHIKSFLEQNSDQKISVLFGRERTGLENHEIAKANCLIQIPVNPEFGSLNLSQAVMVIAYEIFCACNDIEDEILPTGKSTHATQKEFDEFVARLETLLDERGFFKVPEVKDQMKRNIRNLLARATPTDQELRTWHGILTSLIK